MHLLTICFYYRQSKSDISENRRAMTKLRLASEVCKHTLSTLQNAQCAVDSLYDGIDFHYNVSRGRFEVLCNNLLQESIQLIEQILRETQLNKSDIQKVILCGGGSNVPILQKTIGDYLKESTILSSITSDEVIAIGAAKQVCQLNYNMDL
ncbi:hypothetical protein LOTGIDRAFT_134408 [Lottia gigantea]|uniref:Uncharacterized protein n=1 Tax=Lottia gigantea TaxID=225164 RepID=V4B2G6_LOTGI|nr:hypothetical protein LOTGIDRAFT_134408 [Lottia gigantea]ESO82559.1 hypothetical protein LOTGIDRAFT_134408 [Lottia gigantea]